MESSLVQELLDRQKITDVLFRYARGIDRQDKELVRSAFFPDAIERHPEYHGDRDLFIELTWRDLTSLWRSQHFISNISIEFDGDRAYTECYARVVHLGHPAPPADSPFPPGHVFHGIHRYIDIFERRRGEWRIVDRTLALTATRNESHVKLVAEKPHWNVEKVDKTDLSYVKQRSEDMFQAPPEPG